MKNRWSDQAIVVGNDEARRLWLKEMREKVARAEHARPGRGGSAWSWPGYVVDRTPYGVSVNAPGRQIVLDRKDWPKWLEKLEEKPCLKI